MVKIIDMKDPVVAFVRESCKRALAVRRAWLFGSRALGTHQTTSDYDFAFDWDESSPDSWGEFATILREKQPTLNSLDLVRLSDITTMFATKIAHEGTVIYDKNQPDL